jgi:hypothetical protein
MANTLSRATKPAPPLLLYSSTERGRGYTGAIVEGSPRYRANTRKNTVLTRVFCNPGHYYFHSLKTMNCIIANSRDCSREGILAYLQGTWQACAAASTDALQHTLQQCSEGLLLYYIPFSNADAALLRGISKTYKRMKIIAFVDSHNAYHLRQCIHSIRSKKFKWMLKGRTSEIYSYHS